jgi:O-antigen/teichoic acid export membrane protein
VLARSRDQVYAILVPVVLGMAIGLPAVLQLWAPASYHPATLTGVTVLVVVSTVAYAASLGPIRVLLSTGRTRTLAVATAAAAVVNVALNLVLVPAWGIDGSAAATVISYVVLAAAVWAVSRPALRLPSLPVATALRLVAAVGVAAASVALPTSAPFFEVRLGIGALTLIWLVRDLKSIVNHNGVADLLPITTSGEET